MEKIEAEPDYRIATCRRPERARAHGTARQSVAGLAINREQMTDRIVDVALAAAELPRGGLLLVGCCEGEPPETAALPEWTRDLVRSLGERPGWKGREGQWAESDTGRDDLPHVALRGLGKRQDLHVRKLGKWLIDTAAVASLHGVARLVLAL